MSLVVLLIAAALVFLLLRLAARPERVFVIRVTPVACEIDGRVPGRSPGDVEDFLKRDVRPRGEARIEGLREHDGIRLSFQGALDEGQQQQVRNFLHPGLRGPGPSSGGAAA